MKTDLVFCFLSCLVKFPAREANSWRKRASSNPGNWVCVSYFSFFSPSYRFSIFSRSNPHTHTNKKGAKTRGKAERRQRSVLHTRFLDYRMINVSLGAFIQSQIWSDSSTALIINPGIVANPTSRSTSVLFPLAFWHLTIVMYSEIVYENRRRITETSTPFNQHVHKHMARRT